MSAANTSPNVCNQILSGQHSKCVGNVILAPTAVLKLCWAIVLKWSYVGASAPTEAATLAGGDQA